MEFQVIFLSSLFFVNGNKLVEDKSSSFKKETLAQLTFFFLMLQRLTNFLVNLRQEGTINNWSFCAKFDALTLSHVILNNGLEWLQLHFASGDIEAKKNGQKCIGCPYSKTCKSHNNQKKHSCCGCCNCESKQK